MKPSAITAAGLLSVAVLSLTVPAFAHVPALRGRLVEWVQDSDAIVVGTVQGVVSRGTLEVETTLTVEASFAGAAPIAPVKFTGRTRLAPGKRYVVFLQHRGEAYSTTPSSGGGVFESAPADDAAYRAAVEGIRRSLATGDPVLLRSVLIEALSASPSALRYHAAFELAALGEHDGGMTQAQRGAVQRLLADPSSDPALRPFLTQLLGRTDGGGSQ